MTGRSDGQRPPRPTNPTSRSASRTIGSAMAAARSAPDLRRSTSAPWSPSSRLVSEAIGARFATSKSVRRLLERTEALASMLLQHRRMVGIGQGRIDPDQVSGLRPISQLVDLGRQWHRIGLGSTDLERDCVGVVVQVDAALIRRIGLRHLLCAIAQTHHTRGRAEDHRLDVRKEINAVIVVEFLCDIVGKFQMLPLIVTHRHPCRMIGVNVCGHQVRIDI